MPAIDDLTELVEGAAAAERTALASKWKERTDVEKLVRKVRKSAADQREMLGRHTDPALLSSRWVALRRDYLDLGAQDPLPEPELPDAAAHGPDPAAHGPDAAAHGPDPAAHGPDPAAHGPDPAGRAVRRLSHTAAAQAERDAVAAVGFARMALTDAALAVLQARLARIDAGEDDPDAATVDGHVPLHGRNPVSRHGPALAHGVTGEIKYNPKIQGETDSSR